MHAHVCVCVRACVCVDFFVYTFVCFVIGGCIFDVSAGELKTDTHTCTHTHTNTCVCIYIAESPSATAAYAALYLCWRVESLVTSNELLHKRWQVYILTI